MRKSAVVFVAVTVFGFAFVHSANAITVPVDTPTAAASPNIFQALVTELVEGAAAIIASIETTVGSIANSIGSASQSTNYTYTAAVGTVIPPPRLVVSGEGANASNAPARASAATPPAPPSIPTVTPASPTVPITNEGPSDNNVFELESAVSDLTKGVQGLTALIEAQTPSSKIESQIAALQSALSSQGSGQSYNASAYVPLGDGAPNTIAAASNIGNLSGATITNANLTASEIPNLSASYLSLGGGNLTGALGIGTTTPWGDLSVDTPANSSLPELVIGSSTATSLFVSNAGNVGIGTASPIYDLEIDNTASTSLQNGLIGWWPLNEGSGTVVYDRVNSRNGIFAGSPQPTWVNDGGNAVEVDGAQSTGISVQSTNSNDTPFQFASDFSVSIWAKIGTCPASCGGNYAYLIGNEIPFNHQGFLIAVDYSDAGFIGDVFAGVESGSSIFTSAPVAGDGNWHNFVLTRSGSTATLYMDGAFVGSVSNAGGAMNNLAPGLNIGYDEHFYTSNEEIADARIWNRALSTSEASTIYSQGRVGQNPVTKKYTLASSQSTDSNSLFGVGNLTGQNDLYSPTLFGYRNGSTDTPAISLTGLVSSSGDNATDTTAAVQVNGLLTSNPSDPLNGNLGGLSNRDIFSVNTIATSSLGNNSFPSSGTNLSQLFSVAASGNVGIGTSTPSNLLSIVKSTNAATSSVTNLLSLMNNTYYAGTTVSAPIAGFGTGILFGGATATNPSGGNVSAVNRNMAQISAVWTSAVDSSRTSALTFSTVNNGGSLTERIRITGSGNVGIGTTTPYSRLEVFGPDTASTSVFAVVNSASTTEFTVYDTGNAILAGSLVQNSDIRLKTNISDLDGSSSLAEIDALNPVTFNWIDPQKSSVPQFGFIAQQVQQVFPNLVSTTSPTALTPDGTLASITSTSSPLSSRQSRSSKKRSRRSLRRSRDSRSRSPRLSATSARSMQTNFASDRHASPSRSFRRFSPPLVSPAASPLPHRRRRRMRPIRRR